MTLRIERVSGGPAATLRLIGRIQAQDLGELERQMVSSAANTLDLEEVSLVDLDAVRFLAGCRGKGMVLVNCSLYIEEWIEKETGAGS